MYGSKTWATQLFRTAIKHESCPNELIRRNYKCRQNLDLTVGLS